MNDILTKEDMSAYRNNGYTAVAKSDAVGNVLTVSLKGKVSLKIASERNRVRDIGVIMQGCFFISREGRHIHRLTKSFGFNYFILKNTQLFDFVAINYEGKLYRIPKDTILNLGKVMNFKNSKDGNSFELQIFLPINIISLYKIELEDAVQN